MLVYLEQSQEADALSGAFRSPLLEDLPRTGDFFNLGTAIFLQVSSTADHLKLTGWTRTEPLPAWELLLDPPLRLRLTAGIPQVLTGPERGDLSAFAAKWAPGGGFPIALPLVLESRTLVGTLVLLDAPPFDLEDEDFVLAWTQYKYTLLQGIQPRRRSVPIYSEASLMRTLEAGHRFLSVDFDTTDLTHFCDRTGLAHQRVILQLETNLLDLTGQHGAVLWRPPFLTSLFVLSNRMDEDLLWHQIEGSLRWPPEFKPFWERRVIQSPQDLQSILGR